MDEGIEKTKKLGDVCMFVFPYPSLLFLYLRRRIFGSSFVCIKLRKANKLKKKRGIVICSQRTQTDNQFLPTYMRERRVNSNIFSLPSHPEAIDFFFLFDFLYFSL